MKYSKEERLKIGQRIYCGEMNSFDACVEYDISADTARSYMRLYRATHKLPPKGQKAVLDTAKEDPETAK